MKYLSKVDDVRPIITRIVDKQKNEIKLDIVDELIKGKMSEDNNSKKMKNKTNDNHKEENKLKKEDKKNEKYDYINNNYNNYKENDYNKYKTEINYKNYTTDKDNINYKYQNENINNSVYINYLINENLYKYNNNIHDSLMFLTFL